MVTPLGMETPVQKPTIPLGTPLTSVTIAPLHSSFGERTSNLLLAANIKSNDNAMLSMDGLAKAASLDSQKTTNSSVPTSTSSIANGFLSGHTSVSCATSNVGSVLSHIAPHSGNKVLSVPMTLPPITAVSSGAAAASGIAKTSVSTGSSPVGAAGSSLVFHGAPPLMPHSGAGLPMLIQATPYRTSFPHYSALYTPYNNIAHGQYLSQVIPIGSSNTSSSPQRSDARNSRESATTSSLKAPVTSASTHHQYSVSGIGGMRPITPLGYVISNNNTTQVLGTMATTTVTTVPLLNSTHSRHLTANAAGAFGVTTTGSAIAASQLSTSSGISVAATSQLQQSAPMQMLPQTGYPTHLPQVLSSYPQFAPSTSTQQQPLLRCTTTSANGISNTSVLTVQSLMTAMPSTSLTASIASSSVIQKIVSPKSGSPSRDRDTSYRYYNLIIIIINLIIQPIY